MTAAPDAAALADEIERKAVYNLVESWFDPKGGDIYLTAHDFRRAEIEKSIRDLVRRLSARAIALRTASPASAASVEEIARALKPFADAADRCPDKLRDGWKFLGVDLGDCRVARAILTRLSAPAPVQADALAREEAAHLKTIDRRDAAEDALGDMFHAVTGRHPEWSNMFGYHDAIEEVRDFLAAPVQAEPTKPVTFSGLSALLNAQPSGERIAALEWQHVSAVPDSGGPLVVGGYVTDTGGRRFERAWGYLVKTLDGPEWSIQERGKEHVPIEYWYRGPAHPELRALSPHKQEERGDAVRRKTLKAAAKLCDVFSEKNSYSASEYMKGRCHAGTELADKLYALARSPEPKGGAS